MYKLHEHKMISGKLDMLELVVDLNDELNEYDEKFIPPLVFHQLAVGM